MGPSHHPNERTMPASLHPQADQIRLRLDERAQQLAQLIAAEQHHDAASHDVTDLKDGAGDEAQAEIASADVERHLAELRQIEQARARLAAGTYGECVACGEAIAPARLAAQPAAARCTACQAAEERRG
jgi:RNA polymerase-binding transcription factor DksA